MRRIIALILINSLMACTTLSGVSSDRKIGLSDIESLAIGKDNRQEIKKKLGSPAEILYFDGKKIASSGDQEIWIYRQSVNGESAQRVSLGIDRTTGILTNSIWIPFGLSEDSFSEPKEVFAHFKGSSFKLEKSKPMGNGHYYSTDVNYIDLETGVSFSVNEHTNSVTGILIRTPEKTRTPAAQ